MENPRTNAAGRLDRLPLGAIHIRLLVLVGAGMFCEGLDTYVGGGVLGALTASGWSDLAHNAHFVSATFIGMLIGALLAGYMGDNFGRRTSYQVNLLIFGLASFAGALAPNIEWLIAARLIMGIGIGAETVCGYVMIGEFAPPSKRGLFAGIIAVATNSALFAGSLLGTIIIPTIGWRFMFVIVGIGALATWFFRQKLPESPRWLENKGRFAEAEAVLQKIEAEAELRGPLPPAVYQPIKVVEHAPFSALFKPELFARLFVGSMIIIGVSATLYGFITWLPTFFVKQGLTVSSSLLFTTVITLGSPLGNLSSIFLSSRVNRKPLLATLAVIAAVLGIIYPTAVASWQIIGLGFLIAYIMGIMIGIGWALYVPEMFPTELRMRGVGVCNSVGRVMSIAMPYAIIALFQTWGVSGVVFTLSGILFLAAIAILLFGVETRNQSLEAINDGIDELLVANRELKGVQK